MILIDGLTRVVSFLGKAKPADKLVLLSVEKELLKMKLEIMNAKKNESSIVDDQEPIEKKDRFKEIILNLIKLNGETDSKQIYENFPDFTERTIRRRLTSLVEDKVLLRISRGKSIFYTLFQELPTDLDNNQ